MRDKENSRGGKSQLRQTQLRRLGMILHVGISPNFLPNGREKGNPRTFGGGWKWSWTISELL